MVKKPVYNRPTEPPENKKGLEIYQNVQTLKQGTLFKSKAVRIAQRTLLNYIHIYVYVYLQCQHHSLKLSSTSYKDSVNLVLAF